MWRKGWGEGSGTREASEIKRPNMESFCISISQRSVGRGFLQAEIASTLGWVGCGLCRRLLQQKMPETRPNVADSGLFLCSSFERRTEVRMRRILIR